MTEGQKKTRRHGHTSVVMEYLRRYRNQEVSLNDIASDTGLTRKEASGAVSNLMRSTNITTPRRGWYVYRGPLEDNSRDIVPLKAKAEVVALLEEGILISVEKELYIARRLELP